MVQKSNPIMLSILAGGNLQVSSNHRKLGFIIIIIIITNFDLSFSLFLINIFRLDKITELYGPFDLKNE